MKALKTLFCSKCGWSKIRGRGRPNLKCPKCGNAQMELRESVAAEPATV